MEFFWAFISHSNSNSWSKGGEGGGGVGAESTGYHPVQKFLSGIAVSIYEVVRLVIVFLLATNC